MTKFYGKAESAANVILDAFQNPGQLLAALAPIFITRKADIPCRKWSWNNQLITALMGHGDARGFRQWQKVDRHVMKVERFFTILSPVTKKVKDKQTGEERVAVIGFKGTAVFGYSQTDGEPLPGEAELNDWLASLPFREVAELGGAVLLKVLGYDLDADLGGC